jgi:hypothetical protein
MQEAAMPVAEAPDSQDARIKEFRRKADEAKLDLLTGIAQLQAGMNPPVYKKFDDYLHKLYADGMIRKVANCEGRAAGASVSKDKQQ